MLRTGIETADMPFRYQSDDGIVEIIVDPTFSGDLAAIAQTRVVYIVDTSNNKILIDECLRIAAKESLCEVNRLETGDPDDREGNFLNALPLVDLHHYPYNGFVVHGVTAGASLIQMLASRGVPVVETTDGFSASIAADAPAQGLSALTEFLKKEGGHETH